MAKGKSGIYSYIGELNKNNQFHGTGTLHLPSGAKLEGTFQNGKAPDTAAQVITVPQDTLVIDATLLERAEQVIQLIEQLGSIGKTDVALKHHQIPFSYAQARELITLLYDQDITQFYNLSCFDPKVHIHFLVASFRVSLRSPELEPISLNDEISALAEHEHSMVRYRKFSISTSKA